MHYWQAAGKRNKLNKIIKEEEEEEKEEEGEEEEEEEEVSWKASIIDAVHFEERDLIPRCMACIGVESICHHIKRKNESFGLFFLPRSVLPSQNESTPS